MSPQEWLQELFRYERCHECGGDENDHVVCGGPFDLPFAMCKAALEGGAA